MKIVKTIFFVLFALMFINAGLDKFINYMPKPNVAEMPADMQAVFNAVVTLKWLTPLTGLIELVSGILILFPKTRALGAIMILPVMIGIICHNATFMPSGLLIAGVLFLINLWIIGDNWKKYQTMVS